MTPTLHYRARSGGATVDLDRLIASRMLIQANSGAGKSRAIRQLLEETHGRVQHIVIDPEGEFATLRERFDYVLAAGREGDVAAHPKTARVLCRKLVELGASAVLDLYDLELPQRREFVRLFLTELMALPRTLWRPLLIVIDEAHVFVPERSSGDSVSTDSVITLCTQGRKRGFCAVLATQRISKLHKDAAAELLNKLIGRTGLDIDVKRAGDELGFDKEERQSLKQLAPGEFYAYGPAISQTVAKVRTGDVTTSHPEPGTVGVAPPPAPAAIRKTLEQLRDIPKEAEAEARTLADLERKNRDLTAQVRKMEKGAPVSAQPPKVVERTVIDQAAIDRAVAGVRREYEKANADVTRIAQSLVSQAAKLAPFAEQIAERLSAVKVPGLTPVASNGHRPAPAPVVRPTRVATRTEPTEGLTGTQQRMLNAMAFYEQIGVDAPTREQVAGYCGISAGGGSYSTNLSALRTRGLMVDADRTRVSLTDEGRAVAQADAPPSLASLHESWRNKVTGTQARMLDQIIEAYPDSISRVAIADAIGVSADGGSYSTNLSKLRTLGLLVDVSRTEVKGSAVLFPDGLT